MAFSQTLIRGGSQRIPELDGMKLQEFAEIAHSALLANDETDEKSEEFEILNAPEDDKDSRLSVSFES